MNDHTKDNRVRRPALEAIGLAVAYIAAALIAIALIGWGWQELSRVDWSALVSIDWRPS
jgi:hypothetical protein